VKVVVATNAAESSVTIPDCDSKWWKHLEK
jgi:HrpA-like RNA helicase